MANYSKNQNIYNTAAGKEMSADTTNQVVDDTSSVEDFKWVETANGMIKEIDNGIFKMRYNKGYGYWISELGNFYYEAEGKLIRQEDYEKVAASDINGYKRAVERYYYRVPSRHPDFAGKMVFVHHVASYVWSPVGSLRYEKGKVVVDHIDGNSLNNKPSNLQTLTQAQNIAKYQRGEG